MAYSSSSVSIIVTGAITSPSMYRYLSTDSAADAVATGYFADAGAGSRSSASHGMKVGDIVLVQETTGGATPGRCTLHTVTAATADQASTSASTGWNTNYDCTISALTT